MDITYGVITKIPDFPNKGNLCLTFLFAPQEDIYSATVGKPRKSEKLEFLSMAQWELFKLGELLLIGPDGRDQFTRKPSKWDVICEEFTNIEDAAKRVQEVMKEATSP